MEWLFDEFERRNYDANATLKREPFWGIEKWDLVMRFVMAFRHGYAGVLCLERSDMLQERLNEMFGGQDIVRVRHYRPTGITVIYPMAPRSCWETMWSFKSKSGTAFVDFYFASQDQMELRKRLLCQIRAADFQRRVKTLFTTALYGCTSAEVALVTILFPGQK